MPDFDYMRIDQAAAELGVTNRAVNYAIARGDLPGAFKVDPNDPTSQWLIPTASVKAYKKSRTGPLKQAAK